MSDSKNAAEPESTSMLPQSDQNAAEAPQEPNAGEAPPGAGEKSEDAAQKTSKDQRALEISENAAKYKRAADEVNYRHNRRSALE